MFARLLVISLCRATSTSRKRLKASVIGVSTILVFVMLSSCFRFNRGHNCLSWAVRSCESCCARCANLRPAFRRRASGCRQWTPGSSQIICVPSLPETLLAADGSPPKALRPIRPVPNRSRRAPQHRCPCWWPAPPRGAGNWPTRARFPARYELPGDPETQALDTAAGLREYRGGQNTRPVRECLRRAGAGAEELVG